METTPIAEATPERVREVFLALKANEAGLRSGTAKERTEKLKRLENAVLSAETDIVDALHADLRKPYEEVHLTEIAPVLLEIRHARRNLARWMKPKRVGTPLLLAGTASEIRYEAKGVGLIISPWNYTVNLTFGPLVGAVAAGCPIVLKPSEYTPNAARVVSDIIGRVFPENEVSVIQGSDPTAKLLLSQPFRHIYFTGSTAVGRHIMVAAARHLSGITLELGGKSPAIVDDSADLVETAKKIVFGKFSNAGQTCIAPDYLLVKESIRDRLVDALTVEIENAFGSSPLDRQASSDLARIVSHRHTDRLISLLEDAKTQGARVTTGGEYERESCYIEPTILTDVPDEARLLQEEIFGPLLPVLTFRTLDEAIERVTSMAPPLSMYVFSRNRENRENLLERIPSGGACINETLLHFANPDLPFGGLCQSGAGRGHGYAGFLAFTNEKAVLRRHFGNRIFGLLGPPYSPLSRRLTGYLRRII